MIKRAIALAVAGALSLAACTPATPPANDYVICDEPGCGDNVMISVEE